MRTRIGRGSVADRADAAWPETPAKRHSILPVSGLAERNGGRAGVAALAVILALGLGLRAGEAWDGRPPVFDAAAYATIAASLDRGEGFSLGTRATQPASNYSPGLPLLTAAVYKLTGGVHERTARLALALLGTLAVLFTYLIGRRLSGPAAGLIGAAAIAIYPALLEYHGMLMGEPLAATLLSGAVLATFWASDTTRQATWLLPGALFGALALVRPEYLGVAVLVGLVVLLREGRRDWPRTLVQALLVLAGVAVIVVPWTVRNAIALDRFVPVSTGGGQVLFAGTYLPSDGDPEKVGAEVVERHPELFGPDALQRLRLEQILARLAEQRYPGMESDRALSRMGKEQLWDDLGEEPLEYAGFVATKIGRIWSHGPRSVMREPGWELLHWALVAFGLIGLGVLAARRRWEALLIATIFLAITAISALLVASPRRVLVMMPLVAALAGVGVSAFWQRLRLSPGRTSP
jgi:4-amino-4-deoxy-L-arabinose transferase-like glycosyltransferase